MFNHPGFIEEFKELVKELNVHSALEIGCRSGELSQTIGADGIDIDPQVESVIKADVMEFEPDKKYELVYSSGLLEHFTPEKAVEVIQRMAGMSRRYVLNFVPNSGCVPYMKCKAQTKAEWKDELDYVQETLNELHVQAGLKIVKSGFAGGEWAALFGPEPAGEPYLVWTLARKKVGREK